MLNKLYKSGIMGLVVGDALGVPSEYASHEELMVDSINGMNEPGVYGLPKGCWSDDSALTIATLESICDSGLEHSLHSMMDNMIRYIDDPSLNPMGKYMSPGTTTLESAERYRNDKNPDTCGGRNINDNGNGALMRILPVCIYLWKSIYVEKRAWMKAEPGSFSYLTTKCASLENVIQLIESVSALTHAHIISRTACGIYYFIVEAVIENTSNDTQLSMNEVLSRAFQRSVIYYMLDTDENRRIAMKEFDFLGVDPAEYYSKEWNMEKVYDCSAYVVDTFRAAAACLATTESYEECMLKCVNLGGDTDTIAAITGGIAGLYYGYDSIPGEWLEELQMRDNVEALCDRMDS